MKTKWIKFWNSLPPVVRTLAHVGVAAGSAYLLGALADVLSGGALDTNALFIGLGTAVLTAVVKAINPADPSYGLSSGPVVVPADATDGAGA